MNYNSASKYMTARQASAMGRASQKVQALKKVAAADYGLYSIRSGLQLAVIVVDMRTPVFKEHSVLLFDASKKNRYRWMHNMQKQRGLIGLHDTMKKLSKEVPPLMSDD